MAYLGPRISFSMPSHARVSPNSRSRLSTVRVRGNSISNVKSDYKPIERVHKLIKIQKLKIWNVMRNAISSLRWKWMKDCTFSSISTGGRRHLTRVPSWTRTCLIPGGGKHVNSTFSRLNLLRFCRLSNVNVEGSPANILAFINDKKMIGLKFKTRQDKFKKDKNTNFSERMKHILWLLVLEWDFQRSERGC